MKMTTRRGRSAILFIVAAMGISVFFPSSVRAEYCSNITKSKVGYSLVGLEVLRQTLHASGYSTATSGCVTAKWWTTDRCYFPNSIQNERTWTEKIPNGEYACGSFGLIVGINSPWGVVSLKQNTYYLKILF